jgi:cytochrome c-type biogenesis protein CcsB
MNNLQIFHLAGIAYLSSVVIYLLHFFRPSPRLHKCAFSLVLTGFMLQTACLLWRWKLAGFLPVTNLFSTLFFFSWALACCYIYFDLRYKIGASGLFVMLLNLLLIGFAASRDSSLPKLIPSLDTIYFDSHIVLSFLGYAFFAMAFSLGFLYLFQRRFSSPLLPSGPLLRKLNEEAIFLGFVLFTLCMLIGGIWAYEAWGYWFSWNIKGVWSFLVWLFYAGMCHAKFIRRWQGTGYALLSILGFGVVLFTYLGIGLLLESNHPLD